MSDGETGVQPGGVGEAVQLLRRTMDDLDQAAKPTSCDVFTVCGSTARRLHDAIRDVLSRLSAAPTPPRSDAWQGKLIKIIENYAGSYSPEGHEGNHLRLVSVHDLQNILAALPAPVPTPPRSDAWREDYCEHGVRLPHHCDDCLDADIPAGKRIADHPCSGLFGRPAHELSHRNSWPLSQKDHPYCARCGTEIEGPNNTQKFGTRLHWEPRKPVAALPAPVPSVEERLRAALRSVECCLTEAVRDNPAWVRKCDRDALIKARAALASPVDGGRNG